MTGQAFLLHPSDADQVDELAGQIARAGSDAESAGAEAARCADLAAGQVSGALLEAVRFVAAPADAAGQRLAAAGRLGRLALSVWSRAVRDFDRTVGDLDAEWEQATAAGFGVPALTLDRAELLPSGIDDAVAERADAVGQARAALWADLVRRHRAAEERLDRIADGVAALLKHADEPGVQELAFAGIGVNGTIGWPPLTGNFDLIPGNGNLQRMQQQLERMRQHHGSTVDLADVLTFIFADPRACIGDDASAGGCGLEVAALFSFGKVFKVAKAAEALRHADEASETVHDTAKAMGGHARVAGTMASGHVYDKHIDEFRHLGIETREEFASHIKQIMDNPSKFRPLERKRAAYWDKKSRTAVLLDPNHVDGGTAFVPIEGYRYFKRRIT